MADINNIPPKSSLPQTEKTASLPASFNIAALQKTGRRLGISLIKHPDLWLLGIGLCFFASALLIFWTYAWRINQTASAPGAQGQTQIDSALYKSITDHSAQKQKQFQEGLNMEYPDIFK